MKGPSATGIAVVVGNPKPRSRTYDAALRLAGRLGDADLAVDLADIGPDLFDLTAGHVDDLVRRVADSELVIVASPTYKATYTGLLKSFLDRFPHDGLAGVTAVPLMLGASPAHTLAPEHGLRQVLVELGAAVPTRGLYLLDIQHDDDAAYDSWLAAAQPRLPGQVVSR